MHIHGHFVLGEKFIGDCPETQFVDEPAQITRRPFGPMARKNAARITRRNFGPWVIAETRLLCV